MRLSLLAWSALFLGACAPQAPELPSSDSPEKGVHSERSREMIALAIQQNVKGILPAATAYFMEEGQDQVTVAELVHERYLSQPPQPVMGEAYHDLVLQASGGTLTFTTRAGHTIEVRY